MTVPVLGKLSSCVENPENINILISSSIVVLTLRKYLLFIPNFSQQQQHTLEMFNDVLDIIIEDCSREYLEKNMTC